MMKRSLKYKVFVLVALVLVALGLIHGGRQVLYSSSPEALKLSDPELYAEWVRKNFGTLSSSGDSGVVIPGIPGFPSPELYALTTRIYEMIREKSAQNPDGRSPQNSASNETRAESSQNSGAKSLQPLSEKSPQSSGAKPSEFSNAKSVLSPSVKSAQDPTSTEPSTFEDAFRNYELEIPMVPGEKLEMVFIPGGSFMMGSPENEEGRGKDESPQRRVDVSPFWMSSIEIPWEIYQRFMDNGRPRRKDGTPLETSPTDDVSDFVSQPTAPYAAMNLGMGNGYEKGFPAIAMSHYAAAKFCEWLSAQTGEYYRLPTEAEWEYACRAGSEEAYCFGKDSGQLEDYAWFYDNAQDQYQRTKSKKPNAFGLYDMHGNVAEWVLDTYAPYTPGAAGAPGVSSAPSPGGEESSPGAYAKDPYVVQLEDARRVPHIVRGGSWDDDPPALRSAARRPSTPNWNAKDPQNPKSLWYLTDGGHVGFRIVRPVALPSPETMHIFWNASKGGS